MDSGIHVFPPFKTQITHVIALLNLFPHILTDVNLVAGGEVSTWTHELDKSQYFSVIWLHKVLRLY